MNNHNHCWHDAGGATRNVNGELMQLEACCWCGAPRAFRLRIVPSRRGSHGPYVPVKETTSTVPAGLAVNGG